MMKNQNKILNNLLRADFYRIAAVGLDQPHEENRNALRDLLEDFLSDLPEGLISNEAQDSLRKLHSALLECGGEAAPYPALEEEYHRLFTTQVFCPPSEGSYQAVERGPILGDITAFYKAFQMEVQHQEGPPDEMKMELGFMSFMALKEAYALENGMKEEAEITHEAQGKFLKDHLGRWAPLFSERLLAATNHPFYATLALLLKSWVEGECELFQVSPAVLLPAFDREGDEAVKCAI